MFSRSLYVFVLFVVVVVALDIYVRICKFVVVIDAPSRSLPSLPSIHLSIPL